jgi:phage-related protein
MRARLARIALLIEEKGLERAVILRVFVKKTEKTPRHAIQLALSRTKLIKPQEKK